MLPIIGAIASALMPDLLKGVFNVIDRVIPDKDAAQKAKDALESTESIQEFKLLLGQLSVNLKEAMHPSIFVAGWRPWIGWVCGMAFAYTYLVLPMMMFGVFTFGNAEMVKQVALMPALDMTMMFPVLLGMLGLGGMRTYEKKTGSENNR